MKTHGNAGPQTCQLLQNLLFSHTEWQLSATQQCISTLLAILSTSYDDKPIFLSLLHAKVAGKTYFMFAKEQKKGASFFVKIYKFEVQYFQEFAIYSYETLCFKTW